MALISIRSLYPFYKCDCVVDIPDEILKVIRECNREEESYQRKLRYNKVRFESLNADNADEIATRIMDKPLTPYEVYAQKQMNSLLHAAISKLPSKQAKRIFAHFFLGMSYVEIARSEGVYENAVRESVKRGLRNLQKNLISFL